MSAREKRKAEWLSSSLAKNEQEQLQQTLKKILNLEPEQRGAHQQALLSQHESLAAQIRHSLSASQQRKKAKAEHEKEFEDPPAILDQKLHTLADLIKRSNGRVAIHIGAGLSTPAGIPDFRGPQGVWTLQQKGQAAVMRMRYEDARPTKAHMLIGEMVRRGIVSHVVSQNVDGLLLRVGVPADRLSELHGCVYTEVCPSCGRVYTRGYDITAANGTAFRRHVTGRTCEAELGDATSAEEVGLTEPFSERGMNDATSAGEGRPSQPLDDRERDDRKFYVATSAGELPPSVEKDERKSGGATSATEELAHEPLDKRKPGDATSVIEGLSNKSLDERDFGAAARRFCGGALRDTIVHFGERLDEKVLRTAREASAAAELAVTLGTSLKVPPASTLPGLASTVVIVNLQWTAKDKRAALKVNGRCEVVMERLAELLELEAPEYEATEDPVLKLDIQKRNQNNQDCKLENLAGTKKSVSQGRSKGKHKSRTRAAFPRPLH